MRWMRRPRRIWALPAQNRRLAAGPDVSPNRRSQLTISGSPKAVHAGDLIIKIEKWLRSWCVSDGLCAATIRCAFRRLARLRQFGKVLPFRWCCLGNTD